MITSLPLALLNLSSLILHPAEKMGLCLKGTDLGLEGVTLLFVTQEGICMVGEQGEDGGGVAGRPGKKQDVHLCPSLWPPDY